MGTSIEMILINVVSAIVLLIIFGVISNNIPRKNCFKPTKAELIEAKRWRDRNIRLAIEIADWQGWVSIRLLTNIRNFDLRMQWDKKPTPPFLTDAEAQEVLKEACARNVLRETGPDHYELLEGETFIEADARYRETSPFHADYSTGDKTELRLLRIRIAGRGRNTRCGSVSNDEYRIPKISHTALPAFPI